MTAPAVSVIICAYTTARWDDLSAAITSAAAQPATREVVVVIDHEADLLHRAREQWDGDLVKVIANRSRKGLSGARNTGVQSALHDIVAFLDDDAIADENWLADMLNCFDAPEIVGVGGYAIPVWPTGTQPEMLPDELLWIVGCSYRGLPTSRTDVRNVIGCSMAFRRAPLLEIEGFNLDTGRVGRFPLGCEETEACIRLRQANPAARIVFEPRSSVRHRVSYDRATWRYVARRSFYEGVSKSALSKSLGARDALSSERAYTTSVLPAAVWRELTRGRPKGAAAIILSLAGAALGYAYGDLHRRRATRSGSVALIDSSVGR